MSLPTRAGSLRSGWGSQSGFLQAKRASTGGEGPFQGRLRTCWRPLGVAVVGSVAFGPQAVENSELQQEVGVGLPSRVSKLACWLVCGAAALQPLLFFSGFAATSRVDHDTAPPPSVLESVREYTRANRARILRELVTFLSLPNVASDSIGIKRNAAQLVQMLHDRRITTQLLRQPGAPPVVCGTYEVPGASRTVMFYAHYDGQPASREDWQSDPWQPLLRDAPLESGGTELPMSMLNGAVDAEWRLYGRAASDDKGPIVALLRALDALHASGMQPSVNLKFFFEGEEEAGSPHLEQILSRYRDLLAADVWLFCDGPVHPSRQQQVVFGVRGVLSLELTAYGSNRALHSGHYGNWAPNPIVLLLEALSSMRAPDGAIQIEGFNDSVRPLTVVERKAIDEMPDIEPTLLKELGLASAEVPGSRLTDRTLLPAMNVRGIESGDVGERARNAIPTVARASVDFRLVPNQVPGAVQVQVERHLRNLSFTLLRDEPDAHARVSTARLLRVVWGGGYPGFRTPMELPVSRAVLAAVEEAAGPTLRMPSLGGSLPLYLFDEIVHRPVLIVPMVNHDNNQHAADENLRLQNLWDGIAMYANIMARLASDW